MNYLDFIDLYESLVKTSKRLEKVSLLASFLKHLDSKGRHAWIYLLRGRVLPDYDSREFGVSDQIIIKSLHKAYGISNESILAHYKKIGDLGDIAVLLAEQKKQSSLFSSRLSAAHVFDTLKKMIDFEGKGSVDRKVQAISDLLTSATPREVRYIIRTILQDLRVGIADAILIDALSEAYYSGDDSMKDRLSSAYDLANDFALLFDAAAKGIKAVEKITLAPGRPIKVMLPVKVTDLSEAFRICGKPAALEHKYDGFRLLINNDEGKVTLFTRKLENVTLQFPDVVAAIKKYVKGNNFILDSEVVGYDPSTKKYLPFEAISQRIKRKHDIASLVKKLPVEINVFDVVYANGESLIGLPFRKRREILEGLITSLAWTIRPSRQIITDDESVAASFYEDALKIGEEGIMIKALDAPYQQGRRVGYMVKLKPVVNDLDLVIVGAEYGSGKRAGWLTSFIVACKDKDKFLEVGMVSSGLKEKTSEGMSYEEMTSLLKPLIHREEGRMVYVSPSIVVAVTYQNIQKSPAYSSGYALRFPRISAYRPDKNNTDIATKDDLKREVEKQR